MALLYDNKSIESHPKTKVGDLFTSNSGDVGLVVEYYNSRNVVVVFIDTMYETTTSAINIRSGAIKDRLKPSVHGVGFIGDGDFNSTHPAYPTWAGMISRCYYLKYQQKFPTYIGCTVCEEWCNFQNYARWYDKNCPNDGNKYQLDKDIKFSGNKIYSPDTCSFVSGAANTIKALAKNYIFTSPEGQLVEVYNLASFCRSRGLHPSHMARVSRGSNKQHKGWTRAS